MVKRILSVFLSIMLIASIMVPAMSVSANVEVVDIADYTPNLDDDLITSGPNGSEQKAGITSKNLSGKIWTMTATDEQATTTGNDDILQPMKGIQYTVPVQGLQANVPYVLKFVAKKGTNSTATPNLAYGFIDGAKGGEAAGWKWTNQWIYTEDVESTDGEEISRLFTLTYPAGKNTQFKIGLACGNTNAAYAGKSEYEYRPGAVLTVDYSTIYLAPERAYDVENKISMTKVMPGATVMGSAKVINQIGEKGNLDQTVTYFVTDTNGNVKEGVSVVPTSNGEYRVMVDANAADGEYVITARAAAYNTTENFIQQSVTLTVKDEDYSDAFVAPVSANLVSREIQNNYSISTSFSGNLMTVTAASEQTVAAPGGAGAPSVGIRWKYTEGLKNEKYIITFKVKNNNPDVAANLVYGVTDGSMGGPDNGWNWHNQSLRYREVTSDGWETIVEEVALPYNSTGSTMVVIGLGVGNTHNIYKNIELLKFRKNASMVVDMDSFGMYKAGVSKVKNEALTDINVFAGSTIEAKSEVVDAVGTKSNLDQTMEYIVLDSATRKKIANDITITTGENGSYTINVGENAEAGEYVAVVSNTTNGTTVRTGLEFTVENLGKFLDEHEAVMPEGIEFGNMGNGSGYGITVEQTAATDWLWRATAADSRADSLIPTAFTKPAAGLIWTIPAGAIVRNTTYVLSFKVKNLNLNGVTPNVVYGVVDGTQGGGDPDWNWLGQYVWGEDVTSEDWTTYTKSFTSAYNGKSTSLLIGLGTGNTHNTYKNKENLEFRPNAVLNIDNKSVYLAPEAFYDVKTEASKTVVSSGSSIVVDAMAVNQIEEEGNLSQNFSWAALNSSKTDVAEGITITPVGDDTSKVNVAFDRNVEEGTYVIAAYSEDYNAARHIEITVSNVTAVENVSVTESSVIFDAVNVGKDGFSGAVYVAEYNGDVFVKAVKAPFTLSSGNTKGKEVEYTLIPAEGNTLKIYIWDNELTPYVQPIEK